MWRIKLSVTTKTLTILQSGNKQKYHWQHLREAPCFGAHKITEENFDWTKHTTDGVYQKTTLDVTKTVTCAYPWGIDDDLRKKTLTSWKSEKDAKDILSDEALTWFSAGNFESYYHQGSSSWKYDSEAEALSQSLSCSERITFGVLRGLIIVLFPLYRFTIFRCLLRWSPPLTWRGIPLWDLGYFLVWTGYICIILCSIALEFDSLHSHS